MPLKCLCLSLAILEMLPFTHAATAADTAVAADMGTLSTFTVKGTRSSTSYGTPIANTATKIPVPLREVSQPVNVAPRAVIQDQGTLSTSDTLHNVPDMSASLGDTRRDQAAVRGFLSINDQCVDDLRNDSPYFRDPSNIDRVEVPKDPMAALYGCGSSGGIINRVTKKPLATPLAGVGVIVGTERQKRAEFDLNTSINDDAIRAHIIGTVKDSDSLHNDHFLCRQAISLPSLFNLAPDTKLMVQFDYLHDKHTADQDVPSYHGRPADVPIGTCYGPVDAGAGNVEPAAKNVANTLDHRLNDKWSFHSMVRNYEYSPGRNNYTTVSRATGGPIPTVTLFVNQRNRNDHDALWRNELTQKAETWDIQHTLLYGIELDYRDKSDRVTGVLGTTIYSLFDPTLQVLPVVPDDAAPTSYGLLRNGAYAVHMQDLTKFSPRWTTLAGLRYEILKRSRDDLIPYDVDLSCTDKPVNPCFGVVYHLIEPLLPYASHSRSFQPLVDGFTFFPNNGVLAPRSTTNYETGAKYDLSTGAGIMVALFDMKQTNLTTADPVTLLGVPIGTQRTHGSELSFTGEIVKAWSLMTSYTYPNGRLENPNDRSGDVAVNGNQPSLASWHSGSVWLKRSLPSGFYMANGVHAEAVCYASQCNLMTLPGYMTVNLGAGYYSKHLDVTLNLQNLSNRAYYVSAHSTAENYNIPGVPHMALLGVCYKM